MNLDDVTPLILTYNEAPNLARTLAALDWARQIVVVDSFSADDTPRIAQAAGNVWFVQREFDAHARQWNFGLDQVATEWTLALDADYVCSEGLPDELATLAADHDAWTAEFVYAIHGRPLRHSLYPPRVVLFRTKRFRFAQDGHTQLLDLAGAPCGRLRSKITHDDRKPLARWLRAQSGYAELEAQKLLQTPRRELGWKDRLRRGVVWAPPLTLFYCLFWKRLILDGWPGVFYALQRTYAELVLSLELLDHKLRPRELPEAEEGRDAPSAETTVPMEHAAR